MENQVMTQRPSSNTPVVAILNTAIITASGDYEVIEVSNECAEAVIDWNNNVLSAIGHEATAQAASELLGIDVPVNRIQYTQQIGDIALCLKINGRLPEGVILTRDEMEKIGYSWWVMRRLS